MSLEKVLIVFVIGAFIVASLNSLNAVGHPITGEEAIEISEKSRLVKEGMCEHDDFKIGCVRYYNSSSVEQMRKAHAGGIYEKVPEGHGMWEVGWDFRYRTMFATGTIIITVDAETGAIIDEAYGPILW